MKILETNSLSFSYNGKPAIEEISFSVNCGQSVFLLGHNGCGKTTLLKTIAGLLSGYKGNILLNGENLSSIKPQRRADICAFVPGEIISPFDFSVEETVLMGRSHLKKWWQSADEDDYRALDEVLDVLDISKLKNKGINKISMGERHLVFLAQALIQKPSLLLLDEPSSHLDLRYKLKFFEILDKLKKTGISFLMASHEIKPVFHYGDLCLCLKEGKMVFLGHPRDLNRELLADLYKVPSAEMLGRII